MPWCFFFVAYFLMSHSCSDICSSLHDEFVIAYCYCMLLVVIVIVTRMSHKLSVYYIGEMDAYLNTKMNVCVCVHVCISVCRLYVCMYVCMYVCTYVHVCYACMYRLTFQLDILCCKLKGSCNAKIKNSFRLEINSSSCRHDGKNSFRF